MKEAVYEGSINDIGTNAMNDNLLDDLVLDLNNDADEISSLLMDIEMLIYDLNTDLKGNLYSAVAGKFDSYKRNILTIKELFLRYPSELIQFKAFFHERNKKIANTLSESTLDVKKQIDNSYIGG